MPRDKCGVRPTGEEERGTILQNTPQHSTVEIQLRVTERQIKPLPTSQRDPLQPRSSVVLDWHGERARAVASPYT